MVIHQIGRIQDNGNEIKSLVAALSVVLKMNHQSIFKVVCAVSDTEENMATKKKVKRNLQKILFFPE